MASVVDIIEYSAWVEQTVDVLAATEAAEFGAISDLLGQVLARGGTLYVAGNGGSNAQAQHFAADMVGHFDGWQRPLRAIAFGSQSVLSSALSNDGGFEQALAREVGALIGPSDALLLMSTSGESENLLNAAEAACQAGALVVSFVGRVPCSLAVRSQATFGVPTDEVGIIQEVHLLALHLLARLLRAKPVE